MNKSKIISPLVYLGGYDIITKIFWGGEVLLAI